MVKKLRVLLAAVTASACATNSAPPSAPVGSRDVLVFPSKGLPSLSVSLPDGYRLEPTAGIDSQVARVLGPGLVMLIDYGPAGGRQTCGSLGGCRSRQATIDGRNASWIRFSKSTVIDGASFAEQMQFFLPLRAGVSLDQPQSGARFSAACSPDCSIAERIALSVRLK
jgi:hypothetical protein